MIDFATFFAAAHARHGADGPAPYPWQAALAHRLATATPPKAIVVPTGCGKTATIDALTWALAMQAGRSPLLRTVGVRTVWAIDRRILVDEVHEHVCSLADRLRAAATEPADMLHEIALALQSLTGDGSPPLVATRWRGGADIDRTARHPFQPEVITSTVAQVGSRLLFRGYGVGARSLSVQAALTAVDTTICLDEAHLAEPFRATVDAIRAERERERLTLPVLSMITLTATPNASLPPSEIVTIADADRPALGTRLTGDKTARLVELSSSREADVRSALLDAVDSHLAGGAGCVACVVNSVKTAVELFRAAEARFPRAERAILIGPQRPADRARLLAAHRAVLFERAKPDTPLVLVATQTFEVGLDADVEALVTQSASTSALVQRLGRLNRSGTRKGAAIVVRDTESWLYADEENAAWEWLRSCERPDGTIDVSVDGLARAARRPLPVPAAVPPALTSDVLDRLVQTAPRPATMDDPDVDVFLRGVNAEPAADVLVAWRCDLRDAGDRSYREALLRLAAPQPEECVTLSIGRARALLAALTADRQARARFAAGVLDEPDVEGARGDAPLPRITPERSYSYVVLRGGEHHENVPLSPGDIVVLPSGVGGYARATVNHAATNPVEDVGPDLRAARGEPGTRTTPFWRLNDDVFDARGWPSRTRRLVLGAAGRAADPTAGDHGGAARKVAALLTTAIDGEPAELGLADGAQLDVREVTPALDIFAEDIRDVGAGDEDDERDDDAEDAPEIFEGERERRAAYVLVRRPELVGDALRSASGGEPPTLDVHARAVRGRVDAYVERAELPADVAAALALAACVHDHGKSDPRTQAFYRGGTAKLGDVVLAKSVFGTADLRTAAAARVAAGMPRDLRHEVESVAVLCSALAAPDAAELPADLDRELVLHLVGTHHGLGRPVPRLPHGGTPARTYRAQAAGVAGTGRGDGAQAWGDGAWLERFLTVTERYGPWGAAYLGALLVLADRTISAEGS
jgi:CRISPR-associated endonuclease/helicase Cas3